MEHLNSGIKTKRNVDGLFIPDYGTRWGEKANPAGKRKWVSKKSVFQKAANRSIPFKGGEVPT